MPTTIPYAPSLVLGSIVDDEALKTVKAISDLLQPVDAAQETLNSFIAMRRSLKMTADELVNMNITPTELLDQIDEGFDGCRGNPIVAPCQGMVL